MKNTLSVFEVQRKLFLRDKGMLWFYLAAVVLSGGVVPFLSRSMVTSFSFAIFITTLFLKPMLAESIAGERDKKTLESLLSAPIRGKSVLWGKLLFSFLFAALLFGLSAVCAMLIGRLLAFESAFALWQCLCVIGMTLLGYAATTISGAYISATSTDLRTANGRVSAAAYPLGLLMLLYMGVVSLNQTAVTIIFSGIVAPVYLCVALIFGVKALRMKQQKYYENPKGREQSVRGKGGASYAAPKSQFETVFQHELRYIRTIRQLRLSFGFCFVPMLICSLLKMANMTEYLGLGYYDLTVLLTAICVPAATRTMISFSIGGERAYKTGESLLSTPLRIESIFLAKCAAPILVSIVMVILSGLLALTGVNIVGTLKGSAEVEMFSPAQIILLFPVGIMVCVTTIFVTGILSVIAKTPREGLYMASLVSLLMIAPTALIVYTARDPLVWSVVFLIALVCGNIVIWLRVSGNIRRPWLVGRL